MGPGEAGASGGKGTTPTRRTTPAATETQASLSGVNSSRAPVRLHRMAVPVTSGNQDGPHSADAEGFARLTNMILGILTAGIREGLRKFWFIELPLTILPALTLAYSFLTRFSSRAQQQAGHKQAVPQ